MLIGLVFVACDKNKPVVPVNEEKAELIVENVISTDRQDMFMNYAEDYRWYETCIVLKDYLDSENVSDTVVSITSVFQTMVEKEESVDTRVVLISHTVDTSFVEIEHGFWVEDLVLNEELVQLTFKEAYQKVMEVNYPKPHSKQCILRKPLGPINCHPQYIFGNIKAQLYVDAVTGGVTDTNPAFYGTNFGTPLGEWP